MEDFPFQAWAFGYKILSNSGIVDFGTVNSNHKVYIYALGQNQLQMELKCAQIKIWVNSDKYYILDTRCDILLFRLPYHIIWHIVRYSSTKSVIR